MSKSNNSPDQYSNADQDMEYNLDGQRNQDNSPIST